MQCIKFLLVAVGCILSFSSYSQQGHASVSGVIKDSDGQPVPGAVVVLKNTHQGTQTSADGAYKLDNLAPGNYILLISSIGYTGDSVALTLRENQQLVYNSALASDHGGLDVVTVTGKTEQEKIKESGFSVNSIDVTRLANTTADLNQVLNRTSGVRVREQGGVGSDFNFSINGLSGKQVRVFVDGIPLDVFGSAMSLNNVPVNLAERIDVYKGVVPVNLGADAMGGAVNMITNQKIKRYLDASYSYGSFNTHRAAFTGQYTHEKTGIVLRSSFFYNYSDNNYMMRNNPDYDVEIRTVENGQFVNKDSRRFHDRYQSGMGQIELGVMNKKWADVLFVGFSSSFYTQQLQTGFRQDNVIGNNTKKGESFTGTLRYRKDNIVKGLNFNAFVSRSRDRYDITDTSFVKYYWDGNSMPSAVTELLNNEKTITDISRPRTFGRVNLSYELNPNHSFNLNYTLDHTRNHNYNRLTADEDDIPGLLQKHVGGLAYQQELLKKRLTNTFFGKFYGLNLEQKHWVSSEGGYVKQKDFVTNYGYGIATRLRILRDLGIRASYEYTYRLQETEELFGNGINVIGNPNLKPESSNNINVGAFYGIKNEKHKLFIEVGGFYRDAKDFIFALADVRSSQMIYENKSNVRITGVEGEIKYNYKTLISFILNATYQRAINTTKFTGPESSVPEATYMKRIPNQPWFFSNAELNIGKDNLLGRNTRIQLNWYSQYIHWFYLNWENFGYVGGKSDVPTQLIHSASLTYSIKKGTYNISLECRNIMDAFAYDNYRLQKPGRSFSVKLRYFIK